MSSRAPPAWLKKLKRIIGRRIRSGSLSAEAARQLCDEVLPSIQRRPHSRAPAEGRPPPFLGAGALHRDWECFRSGDLGPEDALDLFHELLPQARPGSVYALNQLLTTVASAPVSSTVRDGPVLAVSLFNRMARAGGMKVAPDALPTPSSSAAVAKRVA